MSFHYCSLIDTQKKIGLRLRVGRHHYLSISNISSKFSLTWHNYTCIHIYPRNLIEIIKDVEMYDGGRLTKLLKDYNADLEPGCLDRALKVAVKNDNHVNVGKLVVKGAKELQSCLQYAKDKKKPHARAMLLLIIAAQTGDKEIVRKVFAEPAPGLQNKQDYEDDAFGDVQKAVLSGKISMIIPIEIAGRNGQSQVREELLLKTDVNQEEGYVYWHGLRLLQLDIAWLRKIAWVKKLRLARNGFKSLPPEIATYLKQVNTVFTV